MNNNENKMGNDYGIPRDIYAHAKYLGALLTDIFIVLGTPLVTFVVETNMFPPNAIFHIIVFPIISTCLAVYLILPANGGKKNYHQIMLNLRKHRFLWISFEKGE